MRETRTSLQRLALARPSFYTMATEEVYRYQPLSAPTTIRLIRICPEKVQGCIACRVLYVDEKDQETIGYHALSYLWGNPKHTRQVYLSDDGNQWRRLPLHENLWLFLDNVWQRRLFDQLFWTDYLCIDQKTHRELSQQVQRMHTIYSNATLVVIWLQLDEEHENKFPEFVDLSERCLKKEIEPAARRDKWPNSWELGSVIRNPYWERIWIVQEVVVAKQVCVTTARASIEFEKLHYAFTFADWLSDRNQPSIRALRNMRASGGKIPLWRILKDFKSYKSSHEVDRVFGILGLVEDNEDGSSPVANIKVDYEKPLSHVMLDVLFESPPPLDHIREFLLGEHWERLLPSSTAFFPGLCAWDTIINYVNNIGTTERHRDCARIAFEFLKAFDIMWYATRTTISDKMELLEDLIQSAAKTGWKPTRHESAALIGMMLAGPFRELFMDPFDYLKGKIYSFLENSPWRCSAHGFRNPGHADVGSFQTIGLFATSSRAWKRAGTVDACGAPAEDCDGSTMTCDLHLLQIGFRIRVETEMNGGYDGRLSIQSMKMRTTRHAALHIW